MKIKLIVNFTAGNKKVARHLSQIKNILGLENKLSIAPTGDIRQTIQLASDSVKEGFNLIIAAGGDGTLNAVVNGVMGARSTINGNDISVGFLPLGVSNVFALETGIPLDPIKACGVILNYKIKKVDLGKITSPLPFYFISMAGIGFDGEVVKSINPEFKKIIGGKLAHILTGINVLSKYNPSQFSIICDSENNEHTGYFAVIGNIKSYAGKFRITSHANLDDGLLHICIFKNPRRRDLLRYTWGIITQNHLKFKDVEYLKATRLRILSNGIVNNSNRLCAQIDGEPLQEIPTEIEICPRAINMILP